MTRTSRHAEGCYVHHPINTLEAWEELAAHRGKPCRDKDGNPLERRAENKADERQIDAELNAFRKDGKYESFYWGLDAGRWQWLGDRRTAKEERRKSNG